jgi:DNA-binding transcriptional MerR regulator
MEQKWISISEIAIELHIPENTARRYANLFKDYLIDKTFGRTTKYSESALDTVRSISNMYQKGLSTQEIKQQLDTSHPKNYEIEPQNQVTTTIPPQELMNKLNDALQQIASSTEQIAKFEEHRLKQDELNRAMIEKMAQQQEYIANSIQTRDEMLMKTIREIMNMKTKSTKRWKWWGRN